MGTLHLVSEAGSIASAISLATAADAIVLLEDGVYACNAITKEDAPCPIHAIQRDLAIRGLTKTNAVHEITYDGLVELCVQHTPITTWC